jgi:hypothetical protein
MRKEQKVGSRQGTSGVWSAVLKIRSAAVPLQAAATRTAGWIGPRHFPELKKSMGENNETT